MGCACSINKINNGMIAIIFSKPLTDSNYGISITSNYFGNVRYDMVTPAGFNILCMDPKGKPSADLTIDISLEINI